MSAEAFDCGRRGINGTLVLLWRMWGTGPGSSTTLHRLLVNTPTTTLKSMDVGEEDR